MKINEPEKKYISRVSMEQLVKSNYIQESQTIYTKGKKNSAIVLADGNIKNGIGCGSIHKIGSMIKETESCNGWMFWYVENQRDLILIDEYRKKYRQENELQRV